MKKTLKNIILGTCLALTPILLSSRAYAAREFIRGDVDGDGKITLTDPVQTLNYLFKGGQEPDCEDAMDVNDDGKVDLGDAVYGFGYMFQGRSPPGHPFPNKGFDPSGDELTCKGEGDLETVILTSCRIIDKPGFYVLANDVSSDGTCFTIVAPQVDFDGRGHKVTYGTLGATDHDGVLLDKTFEVSVKNLVLENPNEQSYGNKGIRLAHANNNLISKNVVITKGVNSDGIHLFHSDDNTVALNTISTSGEHSYGIYTFKSHQNMIEDNSIANTGNRGRGVDLTYSDHNKLSRNTIATKGEWAYGLIFSASPNNPITESEIHTEGIGSAGILIFGLNDHTIASSRISSAKDYGIYINDADNTHMRDTFISAPDKSDVYVSSFKKTTNTYLTNVVLANNKIEIGKTTINPESEANKVFIEWYGGVEVKDNLDNPVSDAYITGRRSDGNDFVFSAYTNFEGRIEQQTLLGSIHTANGVEYPSYDLTATHPDYNNPAILHLDKIEENIDWKVNLGN